MDYEPITLDSINLTMENFTCTKIYKDTSTIVRVIVLILSVVRTH
jgi:hypothetical protein